MQILSISDKEPSHNYSDCMRGVVFGINTAAVCVVILDDILKNTSKKVIAFCKGIFKGEVDKLVN